MKTAPHTTPLSAYPKKTCACRYGAPLRKWERSENGWTSRAWEPGEKAEYERTVLNREPGALD